MKASLLLSLLFPLVSLAAEQSRTWTDDKGRTMVGTLMAKDASTAEILLKNGKRTPIKIATLSKADQDYIAKADVHPEPRMTAQTVEVDSNESRTKLDRRRVEVDMSRVHDREYTVTIHWLGPIGNKVGIYKSESKDVSDDGKIVFDVVFDGRNKKGVGADYKGYVVGLWGDVGPVKTWVAKSASQKPFERFLDAE